MSRCPTHGTANGLGIAREGPYLPAVAVEPFRSARLLLVDSALHDALTHSSTSKQVGDVKKTAWTRHGRRAGY